MVTSDGNRPLHKSGFLDFDQGIIELIRSLGDSIYTGLCKKICPVYPAFRVKECVVLIAVASEEREAVVVSLVGLDHVGDIRMCLQELLEVRSIIQIIVQCNDDTVIDCLLGTTCVIDPLILDDIGHGSAGCCKNREGLGNIVAGSNMLECDLCVRSCHKLLPVRQLIEAVGCDGSVQCCPIGQLIRPVVCLGFCCALCEDRSCNQKNC